MTTMESGSDRHSSTDVVAGLLAVASMFLSAIAIGAGLILQLDARPARSAIAAAALAIIAARMSAKQQHLAFAALMFAFVAWVVGLSLAVITENSLI